MMLLEALREGTRGVRLALPDHFTVASDGDRSAHLRDQETRVAWFLFLYPDVPLDLGQPEQTEFEVAARWYARAMFDDRFRANAQSPTDEPRTADPSWTPMVEFEHVHVDGAAALRIVHRMSYAPGEEILMAHLLVPLEHGLFEARVVTFDTFTGIRESVLLSTQLTDPDLGVAMPPQTYFDDPSHDARFPDHALSRARASLRWLVDSAGIKVLAPAPRPTRGVVELPALGCVFEPPPRFVREPDSDAPDEASFQRVSFCATDGIEHLQIKRVDELARSPARELRARAEQFTRQLHEENEVRDIVLTTEEFVVENRPHVRIIAEGKGHLGALRNTLHWYRDEHGDAWFIAILATAAVPAALRIAELDASVRSWRRLGAPSKARPWWKFW